jgi:hypothetical protein
VPLLSTVGLMLFVPCNSNNLLMRAYGVHDSTNSSPTHRTVSLSSTNKQQLKQRTRISSLHLGGPLTS